ncbi:unnamed protein product [Thelazia callipaeda]|uniref:KASH domain-containing protein n=1 Tax=Thelazia callipaeda TaxID=103827 RepID=A0A0N5CLF9_THECL|nr:unnamed protein product [Thelazia callipaeda]
MEDDFMYNENEVKFLQVWDQIRNQIESNQCRTSELASELETLNNYSQLAKKSCKPENREIYNALYCVLREELVSRNNLWNGTKCIDVSHTFGDSGLGTLYSSVEAENLEYELASVLHNKTSKCSKKLLKRRPQKILLPNLAIDEERVWNKKVADTREYNTPYRYFITALICGIVCVITLTPHRVFPWFVTWTTFTSPPPM